MLDLITKGEHYLKLIPPHQQLLLFIYTFKFSFHNDSFDNSLVAKEVPSAQYLNPLEAFYLLQKLQCLI